MSFAKAMAHVFFDLYYVFDYFRPRTLFGQASWCALGFPFHNSSISLRIEFLVCISTLIIILCDV